MRFTHLVGTLAGARRLVAAVVGTASLIVCVPAGCGSDSDGGDGDGTCGTAQMRCELQASCTVADPECLAYADNSESDTPGLRISHLDITRPPALSNQFVLNLVLDGVHLDDPACYLDGKGTFTWLLQFDKATGKLKTGG